MQEKNIWSKKSVMILVAIFCTILWGSAVPAVKIGSELLEIAGEDIPSKILFAGYRFALAGGLLLFALLIKAGISCIKTGQKMGEKAMGTFAKIKLDWKAFSILVLLLVVQYGLFYVGVTKTTGVKGSLLISVNSFFVVLIAPFVYPDAKLSIAKVVGCLLAGVGLILVTTNGEAGGLAGFGLGELLVTCCAIAHAISFFFTKHLAKNSDAKVIACIQLFGGGLVLAFLGAGLGGEIVFATLPQISNVLYLGVISALAFMLWSLLLANNPVAKVSIFYLFIPIFGALISGLLLEENIFTWQIMLSIVLVASGIFLVNATIGGKKSS